MSLKDITDAIAANRKPTTGDMGTVGNYPLQDTPGGSFDLGPLVDDSNVQDAGGYPDTSALILSDLDEPETTGRTRTRPLRRFTTARYTFPISTVDGPPLLVTPSGIDGMDIVYCTLTADTINRVRYGISSNDANAGAYLPPVHPIRIEGGPVWLWPMNGATAVAVDVLVVYEDPSGLPGGTGKACGCK
jgi:hypothetical protein